MSEFAKEDVLVLAKAVLEDHIEYHDGDYGEEWSCYHCMGRSKYSAEDVVHDLDCPVLVARDILTNNT